MYEKENEIKEYLLDHIDDYEVGSVEAVKAVTNYKNVAHLEIDRLEAEAELEKAKNEGSRIQVELEKALAESEKAKNEGSRIQVELEKALAESEKVAVEDKKSKRDFWGRIIGFGTSVTLALFSIFMSDIKNSMKASEQHISKIMNKSM